MLSAIFRLLSGGKRGRGSSRGLLSRLAQLLIDENRRRSSGHERPGAARFSGWRNDDDHRDDRRFRYDDDDNDHDNRRFQYDDDRRDRRARHGDGRHG